MTNEKIASLFALGSRWLRADFHLHTQADKEFKPKESNNSAFVNGYIDRLKEEKIHIGTITNHNKFDLEEFKLLYKAAKKEGIFLLPGIELSVDDGQNGVHCLIVFEYKTWIHQGNNHIQSFITEAFVGIHNPENENTRCKHSLKDVFEKLSEHRKDGRDSFMVLAHVEANSGFFEEVGGGRIQEFGRNPAFWENVLGLQKVRTRDKMKIWEQHLGRNLPALLEGSDCKSLDSVGKAHQSNGQEKKCYIKIGSFQFQSIKYALLDSKNRVAASPPEIGHTYLKQLKVVGSRLKGEITLANNLNTLVGIRGSGKSTILELIRYVLNLDSAIDSDYKQKLVATALGSGGLIEANIKCKNGKTYRIKRVQGEEPVVYEGDEMLQVSVKKLLQEEGILYYGQKDLSYREGDANERLFEGLTADRLLDIKAQQNLQEQDARNKIAAFKNQSNLHEKKSEFEDDQKMLNHRLKIFKEKQIDQKLAKQTQFQKDISQLDIIQKRITQMRSQGSSLFQEFKKDLSGYKEYSSSQNTDLFKDLSVKIDSLTSIIEQQEKQLVEFTAVEIYTKEQHKNLEHQYKVLLEEFAKIQQEINEPNLQVSDYLDVNRRLEEVKRNLSEVEKLISRRTQLRDDLYGSLQKLNDLWLREFQILQIEAGKINDQGLPITIEVAYKDRKEDMKIFLQDEMKGQNIQSRNLEKLCEAYPDFIPMFKDLENETGEITSILSGGGQYGRFQDRFTHNLEKILTYRPADRVIIRYYGKPLQDHSLGQRASAVILFLLTQQENNIVLIDQPEDDLDNQSIFQELIKLLLEQKDKTQFIFATHNPNIPVLGDAEKILVMSYDNNKMSLESGNIDKPDIQKLIIKIMEGGQEAFDRRKDIYGSWKH